MQMQLMLDLDPLTTAPAPLHHCPTCTAPRFGHPFDAVLCWFFPPLEHSKRRARPLQLDDHRN